MSANETCEHLLNIAIYLWKKARGHLPTFTQLYCISLNFTSSYSTSSNLPKLRFAMKGDSRAIKVFWEEKNHLESLLTAKTRFADSLR